MPVMSVIAATKQRGVREERQPFELTFFHFVFIFPLCSVIGLVAETLVSYVLDGRWESRAGFVIGPFSPIYGLGAVLITFAINPIRGHSLGLQFAVAGVVGGALEYFAGWFFETRYGIVAWSYIDQPFNFNGHTSIFMMAVWGIAGLAWTTVALPVAVRLVERIPENMRRSLTIVAFAFIMADSVLTIACLDSWFWRAAGHPISNPLQQFCATYFGDDFMRTRFETMSMWTVLASR